MYTKSNSFPGIHACRKSCCSPFISSVTIIICDLCTLPLNTFIVQLFRNVRHFTNNSIRYRFHPHDISCIEILRESRKLYLWSLISLFLLHYEPPTRRKFLLFRDKSLTATIFCDTIFIAIYLRANGKIEETRHAHYKRYE